LKQGSAERKFSLEEFCPTSHVGRIILPGRGKRLLLGLKSAIMGHKKAPPNGGAAFSGRRAFSAHDF
jgi:hypothetical protein